MGYQRGVNHKSHILTLNQWHFILKSSSKGEELSYEHNGGLRQNLSNFYMLIFITQITDYTGCK